MKVHIIEDKEPTLEHLQKLVGGYIEVQYIGNTHLILNEEAHLMGLPVNQKAMDECQKILNKNIRTNHYKMFQVRGDVVILKGKGKLT
tara:strand:+ start:80 stop:343 length:264 start_codon:yes stop_codon:yes gene_type:complete